MEKVCALASRNWVCFFWALLAITTSVQSLEALALPIEKNTSASQNPRLLHAPSKTTACTAALTVHLKHTLKNGWVKNAELATLAETLREFRNNRLDAPGPIFRPHYLGQDSDEQKTEPFELDSHGTTLETKFILARHIARLEFELGGPPSANTAFITAMQLDGKTALEDFISENKTLLAALQLGGDRHPTIQKIKSAIASVTATAFSLGAISISLENPSTTTIGGSLVIVPAMAIGLRHILRHHKNSQHKTIADYLKSLELHPSLQNAGDWFYRSETFEITEEILKTAANKKNRNQLNHLRHYLNHYLEAEPFRLFPLNWIDPEVHALRATVHTIDAIDSENQPHRIIVVRIKKTK